MPLYTWFFSVKPEIKTKTAQMFIVRRLGLHAFGEGITYEPMDSQSHECDM